MDSILSGDVGLKHLSHAIISQMCLRSVFCFGLCDTQTTAHFRLYCGVLLCIVIATGSNWLYQRMITGSRPSHQQRRALCVCIYVIRQAIEAKCGRVPASGQNKPFSPTPSGYTPYFHTSHPGIALSLSMSDTLMAQWVANPASQKDGGGLKRWRRRGVGGTN